MLSLTNSNIWPLLLLQDCMNVQDSSVAQNLYSSFVLIKSVFSLYQFPDAA